jgi:hypothetical protein
MIKGFFNSKKFIVFLVTVIVAAAVMFGVPEEQAIQFVEYLVKLAMAYMGGQGIADAGKYAGEAIARMREKSAALAAEEDA